MAAEAINHGRLPRQNRHLPKARVSPIFQTVARWNNQSRVIPAPGFIEPCLPTVLLRIPAGPQWLHEIKHDGYRLLVRKSAGKVRIYTRRGADWTKRAPASKIKAASFYLDGEGVVCGPDGVALFDKLHSKANDDAEFVYAFDL